LKCKPESGVGRDTHYGKQNITSQDGTHKTNGKGDVRETHGIEKWNGSGPMQNGKI